jgi:hypothetical protein
MGQKTPINLRIKVPLSIFILSIMPKSYGVFKKGKKMGKKTMKNMESWLRKIIKVEIH